jgi:hypothetical protein
MEMLVALFFVDLEMALRVGCDRAVPAPLAQDAQGDLLRHRAARQDGGRLLPQKTGDPRLEARDALTFAVDVAAWPRTVRERPKHVGRSAARARPRGHEARALLNDRLAVALHLARSLPRAS